jgi:hypothetical protein
MPNLNTRAGGDWKKSRSRSNLTTSTNTSIEQDQVKVDGQTDFATVHKRTFPNSPSSEQYFHEDASASGVLELKAEGDATNIGIVLTPKGSGTVHIGGAQIGFKVINKTGGDLTAPLFVYIAGVDSTTGLETIGVADKDTIAEARDVYLMAADIDDDATGLVYSRYNLTGVNTSAFSAAGDPVYLGAAGAFTHTEPSSTDNIVIVGSVTTVGVGATDGTIHVNTGDEQIIAHDHSDASQGGDPAITGGTIDGAVIGDSTPAAITGTDITATGTITDGTATIVGGAIASATSVDSGTVTATGAIQGQTVDATDGLSAGVPGTTDGTLVLDTSGASTGTLGMTAVDNSGDYDVTISNAAHGQSSVISIPDSGQATANFVLDQGAQDISGSKSFLDGIIVGADADAATLEVYPATTNSGTLEIAAADNAAADVKTTLQNAQAPLATTVTLPLQTSTLIGHQSQKAHGAVYFTGRPADTELLTINGRTYEIDAANDGGTGDVMVDTSGSVNLAGDIDAMVTAINGDGSATVTALKDPSETALLLYAITPGTQSITLATAWSNSTVSDSSLDNDQFADEASLVCHLVRHTLTAAEAAGAVVSYDTGLSTIGSITVTYTDASTGETVSDETDITISGTRIIISEPSTPSVNWATGDIINILTIGTVA